MRKILTILLIFPLWLFADEATSSSFTFNSRKIQSPIAVSSWDTYSSVAVSHKFCASTTRLLDANRNGLPDYWEVQYGITDPFADNDGDGLTNLEEFNANSNPLVDESLFCASAFSAPSTVDTHILATAEPFLGDFEVFAISPVFGADLTSRLPDVNRNGLPDYWEERYGISDPDADPDGDGLCNLAEYNANTNPTIPDNTINISAQTLPFVTDTRVRYIDFPHIDEPFSVSKLSGVFVCSTGGIYTDSDGDSIPDWWERQYSLSKTEMLYNADDDNDGASNYAEFIASTDPTSASSLFAISIIPTTSSYEIRWRSSKNRVYKVYQTSDILNFPSKPDAVMLGTGDFLTYMPNSSMDGKLFFKVTVELNYEN